jgi:hypothetical protein
MRDHAPEEKDFLRGAPTGSQGPCNQNDARDLREFV